ncbi:hypothetical protein BKA69DRAFT_1121761 [Paraphysoderma sedebokerense]|nr:hypothetical protein BKA69DRAFT_1121761 [Paraphysoderma sedebokerense]
MDDKKSLNENNRIQAYFLDYYFDNAIRCFLEHSADSGKTEQLVALNNICESIRTNIDASEVAQLNPSFPAREELYELCFYVFHHCEGVQGEDEVALMDAIPIFLQASSLVNTRIHATQGNKRVLQDMWFQMFEMLQVQVGLSVSLPWSWELTTKRSSYQSVIEKIQANTEDLEEEIKVAFSSENMDLSSPSANPFSITNYPALKDRLCPNAHSKHLARINKYMKQLRDYPIDRLQNKYPINHFHEVMGKSIAGMLIALEAEPPLFAKYEGGEFPNLAEELGIIDPYENAQNVILDPTEIVHRIQSPIKRNGDNGANVHIA